MSLDILPHSHSIKRDCEKYLNDAQSLFSKNLKLLKDIGEFRNIFKVALSFDAVLSGISSRNLRPPISCLRSITKKTPLLISMSQFSVAEIQMRQLIELVFWSVFFSEHLVEWKNLNCDPSKGYITTQEKPISFLANRDPLFYINYCKERFSYEPSGFVINSINSLNVERQKINAIVHPVKIAVGSLKILPFEKFSKNNLNDFAKLQRSVFSHSAVILTGFNQRKFNNLKPIQRAWFDWLIGTKLAKQIRSQAFGI